MRKIPFLPLTLVLIALVVATFLLLPRSDGPFLLEPIVDAPQSAMPVAEDAPQGPDDAPAAAPMGDVDEALNAAPAPEASVMPAAPTPVTSEDRDRLGEDRWVLTWLGDEAVPKGDRAPNIVFDMQALHASGYGGCNRYSGPFDIDDDMLSFGPAVATQMACDQLRLEMAYFEKMNDVSHWHIDNGTLVLKDKAGADVARFIKP